MILITQIFISQRLQKRLNLLSAVHEITVGFTVRERSWKSVAVPRLVDQQQTYPCFLVSVRKKLIHESFTTRK